ncbi:hypothetical protein SAMN05421508_10353 [Caenispirillum bisanense]|uniref:Uncharacterized protein n=1 Tax=Caenispirillum bisanense TaxID=414052 RepID=A0A286GD24_9PROT|nr:hypothetical protein SAMN05421508_10353 [Caenispirillum bisanense]
MAAEQNRRSSGTTQENEAEMERYGITKTYVAIYSYGEYRYSSLQDAVAQAKRDEARRGA